MELDITENILMLFTNSNYGQGDPYTKWEWGGILNKYLDSYSIIKLACSYVSIFSIDKYCNNFNVFQCLLIFFVCQFFVTLLSRGTQVGENKIIIVKYFLVHKELSQSNWRCVVKINWRISCNEIDLGFSASLI